MPLVYALHLISCQRLQSAPRTVLYCIVVYCTVLHCSVLYCTVLYCGVLWCTVLHLTVLWCTVLYCIVVYCTVLYCTVLYYTVLSWTVQCDIIILNFKKYAWLFLIINIYTTCLLVCVCVFMCTCDFTFRFWVPSRIRLDCFPKFEEDYYKN